MNKFRNFFGIVIY